jgi:hypothetical protein
MTTLHFTKSTTATPQQFLAALTDFGPGRSEVFPNSKDELETVHDLGPDHADVTEGSKSSWERLTYDWSDPYRVVMTTTDSNIWGGQSGHTYTFTPQTDGTTRLDVVVVREGKNFKGRFLATMFKLGGKKVLESALNHTIKAVEIQQRNPQAETA